MSSVGASAAAAAGAGAGFTAIAAANVSPQVLSSAYPLPRPLATLCCDFLIEDPVATHGLLKSLEDASSGEVAKTAYCFATYVAHRLLNPENLTAISRRRFEEEACLYTAPRNRVENPQQTRASEAREREKTLFQNLRNPDLAALLLSLQRVLASPEGRQHYLQVVQVVCIAAACHQVPALALPDYPEDSGMPQNLRDQVNKVLQSADGPVRDRVRQIAALFPRLGWNVQLKILFAHEDFHSIQVILNGEFMDPFEELFFLNDLKENLKNENMPLLRCLRDCPRFQRYLNDILHVAAKNNAWKCVAFLLEEKTLNLEIEQALVAAVSSHSIESVELLMPHTQGPALESCALLAVQSGSIAITFLFLQSEILKRPTAKDFFERLLVNAESPAMVKMLMDDPRFAQVNNAQLRILIQEQLLRKGKLNLVLVEFFMQHRLTPKEAEEFFGEISSVIATLQQSITTSSALL